MTDLVYRVARFFALFLVYFRPKREPIPEPTPIPTEDAPPRPAVIEPLPVVIEPAKPPQIAQPRTRRPHVSMKLKESILDQLDDNTKVISRMKAFFPSEYGLYSQLGAVIIPHEDPFLRLKELITEPISPWFGKVRPAFGAVVTGNPHDETKGKDDPLAPRLTHFLKIEQSKDLRKHMFGHHRSIIQPIALSSSLYIFTHYYDERDWARLFPKKSRADWKLCKFYERAFAVELPIELTWKGEARPLKIVREQPLPCPVSKHDRYRDVRKTVKKWDYPYSKEYFADFKGEHKWTPETFILHHVGYALRCYEEANASMIQVRASKNGVATLINVNVEQTPGFFDDRDDVWVDGVKKRIFHVVRAHERVGSKGVRIHFRGLRQFAWNGYQIEISVPGRDHLDVREYNVPGVDEEDTREPAIDLGDVAGWLVDIQRARAGAMVGKPGQFPPPPRSTLQ